MSEPSATYYADYGRRCFRWAASLVYVQWPEGAYEQFLVKARTYRHWAWRLDHGDLAYRDGLDVGYHQPEGWRS